MLLCLNFAQAYLVYLFSPSGCLGLKMFSLFFKEMSTIHGTRRDLSQGEV
jgi:hypothetical protein